MSVDIVTVTETEMRKEKRITTKKTRAFRRSRAGCRNCKLRKVKCDQTKPQCRCCLSFGVVCNYGINVPDLRPSAEAHPQWPGTVHDLVPREKAPIPPLRERISSKVVSQTSLVTIELDTEAMRVMNQFYREIQKRFGFPVDNVFQLTKSYPFLMHATLALSFAHDRSLTSATRPVQGRTLVEMNHFFQCTALFNRHLRDTIDPLDRDPIWATASWLSILSFLAIDESEPSKAWPFKGSESPDLDFLRMGDTKWKLYHLTDPLRPESIFHSISGLYQEMRRHISASGIDSICPSLHQVCGLNASSRAETNPYFHAAQTLSNLNNFKQSVATLPQAMSFITHAYPAFKALLLEKDPVALLLFALWYSKARKSIWWVDLRASIEYDAICMYLRKYHADNSIVMDLLPCDGRWSMQRGGGGT